jgi:hypothetical protein
LVISRSGGAESEKIGELLAIDRVFVDTELKVLGELLVKLLVLLFILGKTVDQFEHLLNNVLADNLEDS